MKCKLRSTVNINYDQLLVRIVKCDQPKINLHTHKRNFKTMASNILSSTYQKFVIKEDQNTNKSRMWEGGWCEGGGGGGGEVTDLKL